MDQYSPQEGGNAYTDIDQVTAARPQQQPPTPSAAAGARQGDQQQPDANAPSSFCTLANLKVAQVNIFAGTLNGYSIGFVGVYSNLYGLSTDCSLYQAETSCTTLSNANCVWDANTTSCGWREITCSKAFTTESGCHSNKSCTWSYSEGVCKNRVGFSSSENGIFAGAMIVGCMLGSFFAGPIAKRLGPKVSFIVVGIVGIVCSVMYHVATAVDQFWVLNVGRLLVGMVLGLVCVAAPMYVSENAAPKYSKMIGVMFQVFTTFGIFIAATVGLGVGQSVKFDVDRNQMLMARMQALCAFSTLFSLLMILLGILVGGSGSKKASQSTTEEEIVDGEQSKQNAGSAEKQYTFGQMLGPLIMGGVVAGTLQLTGINAVMNYAPTIMGSLGLAPLVGNFVVMVWNFVTTICSIPLASIFTMRQLFLGGSLVTSVSCLFLCGIPVFPGLAASNVKNGVAITGILIFIAAFEFAVGPCFYVLAQDLFPPSFRPKGASCTMVIQFIFNVIINVCYPIATEKISGGPSGNQDKGQSIAFIFFGGIGLICFVFQVFFLHPYDAGSDAGAAAASETAVPPADRVELDENAMMNKPVEVEHIDLGVEKKREYSAE